VYISCVLGHPNPLQFQYRSGDHAHRHLPSQQNAHHWWLLPLNYVFLQIPIIPGLHNSDHQKLFYPYRDYRWDAVAIQDTGRHQISPSSPINPLQLYLPPHS